MSDIDNTATAVLDHLKKLQDERFEVFAESRAEGNLSSRQMEKLKMLISGFAVVIDRAGRFVEEHSEAAGNELLANLYEFVKDKQNPMSTDAEFTPLMADAYKVIETRLERVFLRP